MIAGFATPDGTQSHASHFASTMFRPLGSTGLVVSAAGFGGYRISAGVRSHAEALEKALTSGINLIDTSANYTDGASEQLIGQVLGSLINAGRLTREAVVVISKGGYLQGKNYALSQQRKAEGRPFAERVDYGEGLEHCIHPDFLADQISRSLERLELETLDGYLLHNPEYYLEWAHRQGIAPTTARQTYYQRIENAFRHLESEVAGGRIRFYGISSNTFPTSFDDPEFTQLQKVWESARNMGPEHHFRLIQLPFNLFETGAVLVRNQPGNKSVLALAREIGLGVITNRPLNAFHGSRLIRLADIDVRHRMDYRDIIDSIKSLAQNETRLWRKILPTLEEIPGGLKVRIKQQGCFAESLKHHWRSFGSYERWREVRDGVFLPRIQGVVDFLTPLAATHPELKAWLESHARTMDQALRAVASIYADAAMAQEKKIKQIIAQADAEWGHGTTLSQNAIDALISTAGVTSVLVGMRQSRYVADVMAALDRDDASADRTQSWQRMRDATDMLLKK